VTLSGLHDTWAWVVVLSNGAAGCWALAANWLEPLRGKPLWWFVAAAELSIFVQVILGVVMVAGQGIQVAEFHMFYGFVAIITVGIIYSYRQQLAPHRYVLYGLGSWFLMGLGIRAMLLGHG
jgi:hypothetical protein